MVRSDGCHRGIQTASNPECYPTKYQLAKESNIGSAGVGLLQNCCVASPNCVPVVEDLQMTE